MKLRIGGSPVSDIRFRNPPSVGCARKIKLFIIWLTYGGRLFAATCQNLIWVTMDVSEIHIKLTDAQYTVTQSRIKEIGFQSEFILRDFVSSQLRQTRAGRNVESYICSQGDHVEHIALRPMDATAYINGCRFKQIILVI